MSSRFSRLALPLALVLFCSPSAWADAPQDVVDTYSNMCMQMAKMATPANHITEFDIKDSPQLPGYCACFGKKFGDRAMTQPRVLTTKTKAEVDAALAEERQMRITCRAQYGLPSLPPYQPLVLKKPD